MSPSEQMASTSELASAPENGSKSRDRPVLTDAFCVFLILGFVLLAYVATANVLTTQEEKVNPTGDPFTYTLGFIEVRDIAQNSYYRALRRAVGGNWYWLQNFAILFLSPILGRDPASIAAMNYLCLAIALCSLYAVGRQLTRIPAVALLGVAGLVHLPWLYGTMSHGQLLCVTLDCTFIWMVAAAWSCLFLYVLEPDSCKKAIFAAVTTSMALCGRGNSLPIVGVVLGVPLAMLVYRVFIKGPRIRLLKPAAMYFLLNAVVVGFYLWVNLGKILEYYAFMRNDHVPAGLLQKLSAMCTPPRWVVYNIPSGLMLSNQHDTRANLVTSVLMHVFMALAGAGILWHSRRMQEGGKPLALLVASLLSIYVATFGLGIYAILGVQEHRTYHVFNMMLLAFSVMLMATIVVVLRRREVLARGSCAWVASLAGSSAFVCAVLFSKLHSFAPTDLASASASEVRAVSVALDRMTGGRSLAVMWYNNYNPVILNYYRFLEGLPACHLYSDYSVPMFHAVADRIDSQDFHDAVRLTLEEADFVIIPQNPADCQTCLSLPIATRRRDRAECVLFRQGTTRLPRSNGSS